MKTIIATTFVALLILLRWSTAHADDILVCQGPYRQPLEDRVFSERPRIFAQRMALELGAETTTPFEAKCNCADSACLEAAAQKEGKQGAVAVEVTEEAGHYSLRVFDDTGQSAIGEVTGPFEAAVRVALRLARELVLKRQELEASQAPVEQAPLNLGETMESATPDKPVQAPHKPVPKKVFFVSLGLSAAVLAAAGVMDIVVYRQYRRLQDTEATRRSDADQSLGRRLQAVEHGLLVASGLGVVTTLALGLFADFKEPMTARRASGPRLGLFTDEHTMALIVGGEF